jgi:methionyl-tRNA formyltransferase
MRIAFMGTPDFAAVCLAALAQAGHEIALVYSQPPAPRGRGQVLTPSAVHAKAQGLGLAVRTPASMRDAAEIAFLQTLELDALVVVAFGQILPAAVLEAPRFGSYNLHASLLPRWRGAAPIQRAIMAGDAQTGAEVMRMTEGLDEGPVIARVRLAIAPDETARTLHDRLAEAGSRLLVEAMDQVARGVAVQVPQAAEGVTYAKKIRAAEARIDWSRPAAEVDRHIRGLSPFPGAWFEAPSDRGPVRVKALLSQTADAKGEPGQVLDEALTVACGEGAVRLLKAQREGKGAQEAGEFLRGFAIPRGTRLS